MTESEWDKCSDPDRMLPFLEGKTSERKLRLFACACCRRIWHLLSAEQARQAVETSERYADGEASYQDLINAASEAIGHCDFCYQNNLPYGGAYVAYSAASAYERDDFGHFGDTACLGPFNTDAAIHAAGQAVQAASGDGNLADRASQADLLREIIGNPLGEIPINTYWLKWNDGIISRMAHRIYAERSYSDLLVLADALEEAGCSNNFILDHCRQQNGHVRGCWVVDLLLGKQ